MEQFVAFAEQLSFCNTHGLIPLLSPVMPLLSPLVMIFVFQVDDINADKNVSSAQIIGESETLESFSVLNPLLFSHLCSSLRLFLCLWHSTYMPRSLPKCSMVEMELRISHFQKEKIFHGSKESPKFPVSVSDIIILFHLAVFSHPQVRYVPAASISTVPGNTKIFLKFGH